MMKWMKNTSGKPDAVLTMAFIGFLIVVIKVLMAGSTLVWNGDTISFGEIDATTIGAILTPTLGAYVARRYTDKKFPCLHDENCEEEEEE